MIKRNKNDNYDWAKATPLAPKSTLYGQSNKAIESEKQGIEDYLASGGAIKPIPKQAIPKPKRPSKGAVLQSKCGLHAQRKRYYS